VVRGTFAVYLSIHTHIQIDAETTKMDTTKPTSTSPISNPRPCLNCNQEMVQSVCKVLCTRCGYFEDCSNLI
jgi:hypothetical protein